MLCVEGLEDQPVDMDLRVCYRLYGRINSIRENRVQVHDVAGYLHQFEMF